MSIFPTKILLATDGSEAAELALHTAVALAKSTDSELHVLTAMPDLPDLDYMVRRYPFRSRDEALEAFEQGTKTINEEQVRKITDAGGLVGGTHLKGSTWKIRSRSTTESEPKHHRRLTGGECHEPASLLDLSVEVLVIERRAPAASVGALMS